MWISRKKAKGTKTTKVCIQHLSACVSTDSIAFASHPKCVVLHPPYQSYELSGDGK